MGKIYERKIRAGIRDQEAQNHWIEVDPYGLHFSPDKNIVIFGGNTTNRPDAANGNAKIIQSLIPDRNIRKTKIYSFMYESEPVKSERGYLSREYDEEMREIYHESFEPLLFDRHNNIKRPQGIEKVFEDFVFVAHCGGSCFVNILIEEFQNTLLKYYAPREADNLIRRIQYFAYAPSEMPSLNINSLIIAPFNDPNFSWEKTMTHTDNNGLNSDYPRGVLKRLKKSALSQMSDLRREFTSTFEQSCGIAFKSRGQIFYISGLMNSDVRIGDHSIACLIPRESNTSESTEQCYSENTRMANKIASAFFAQCLSSIPLDIKGFYGRTISTLEENPPAIEKPAF